MKNTEDGSSNNSESIPDQGNIIEDTLSQFSYNNSSSEPTNSNC